MKTHFTLEQVDEIDFSVLAINSHAKGYKLCWNINKELQLNFEKVEDKIIDNKMMFSRYFCTTRKGDEYNIITNQSKKGYFVPDQKNVNYFFIVNNKNWLAEKKEFITKLRENKEVLLVFELQPEKNKYINRFIFHDEKN